MSDSMSMKAMMIYIMSMWIQIYIHGDVKHDGNVSLVDQEV